MDERPYTLLAVGFPLCLTFGIVLTFTHSLFVVMATIGGFGTGYMYRDVEAEKEEIRKELTEEGQMTPRHTIESIIALVICILIGVLIFLKEVL